VHALETTPSLADLRATLAAAQHKAHDVLAHMHLPTRDEISARAASMFVKTRSLDDIVERAHRILLEAVGTRLALAVDP
jgi:stearoyl-CoA desaturase (delta-9 desaturase)